MSPTRFIIVNGLTFVRCRQKDLIIGKKYMFVKQLYFDKNREVMTGTITDKGIDITKWNNITYINTNENTDAHINANTSFKKKDTIEIDTYLSRITFLKLYSSKSKIQQAMEIRAINLILQNITGDKMFKY